MKVLISSYSHVGIGRGGMLRQIEQTVASLHTIGVDCVSHSFDRTSIEEYSLLHIYSLDVGSIGLARAFKRAGKPVIVSAVFNSFGVSPFRKWIEKSASKFVPGFLSSIKQMRELVELSDKLVVLNGEERELLESYFTESRYKCVEIPNGFSLPNGSGLVELRKTINTVLNVGEVCPRKNQLNLIKAAENAGWELIIVGRIPSNDYSDKCKKLAKLTANVRMLGELPYESVELQGLYRSSYLFCLPSYSEVQSLALIEAGKYDCEVAVSQTIPVDKRLQSTALLFHPSNPYDIKRAIALGLTMRSHNIDRMADYPSWDDIAKLLLAEYEKLVGAHV